MAVHPDDRRIAKKVLELRLVGRERVQEAGRILLLRQDRGEATSLDEVLFERQLLSAREVLDLQRALALRAAHCPCGARLNVWAQRPGARVACADCRAPVQVPGADREDPFALSAARPQAPAPRDGAGLTAIGVCATLGLGAALVDTAVESRATHMGLAAGVCAGAYTLLVPLLSHRLRWPTMAGLGLALFSGLLVACGLGNAPGARALVTCGLDAHLLLAPLVLVHLLLLLLAGQSLLTRARPTLMLGAVLPLVWGLVFFTWRSVPGTDAGAWLRGPGALDALPWYAHPGAVTLLLAFPLGAGAFLLTGLQALRRGAPHRLLRHGALAASLLLLSGFGLTVGAASGRIPEPRLRRAVEAHLAARLAPCWRTPVRAAPTRGTVAAAIQPGR